MVAALGTPRTFVKFCLTGLSGVVVNLGSFQLLLELGVHKYLASPIAIEISVFSNFFINNYWTFADRDLSSRKRIRGLRFHIVSLLALGVSYSTFVVLSVLLPQVDPVWLQGCGIAPGTLVNYVLNSYWTFREEGVDRLCSLSGTSTLSIFIVQVSPTPVLGDVDKWRKEDRRHSTNDRLHQSRRGRSEDKQSATM